MKLIIIQLFHLTISTKQQVNEFFSARAFIQLNIPEIKFSEISLFLGLNAVLPDMIGSCKDDDDQLRKLNKASLEDESSKVLQSVRLQSQEIPDLKTLQSIPTK